MTSPSTTTATTLNLPESHPESSNEPRIRTTKRKLDDAFQSLDDAVGSSEPSLNPPPLKRTHTVRSLYSTLAKYGIKPKEAQSSPNVAPSNPETSKSTPHLTAILARAATRTRKALPFKFSSQTSALAPTLPPTAEYRPSSITAFLTRLATFKLATYAQKPPVIDAVAAAKCGWTNDGKDRLVCGLCKNSWVVGGKDGMNKDAANALIEKQRISLVEMHKDGCPWKTRQCDPTIYRIPLQSPAAMVRDIKLNAIALTPFLQHVEIKHPLTSTQLNSLHSTLSAFTTSSKSGDSESEETDVFTSTPAEPSDTAMLTSLFGWSLVPPEPPRRSSLSRANSLAPSAPRTPSLSRATSMRPMSPSTPASSTRPPTPTPAPLQASALTPTLAPSQRPPMTPTRIPSTPFTFRMPSNISAKRDSSLLQCVLCQRRVGLWAFAPNGAPERSSTHNGHAGSDTAMEPPPTDDSTAPVSSPPPPKKLPPQRQFDLLKEHRSYCPYVVRSTVVPSLPVPPPAAANIPMNGHARSSSSLSQLNGQSGNNALEGWRAVLTVVLRYGLGQRQRLGFDFAEDRSEEMEVDGVKAMVAGVKSRGGKDLLRYVKGLLG